MRQPTQDQHRSNPYRYNFSLHQINVEHDEAEGEDKRRKELDHSAKIGTGQPLGFFKSDLIGSPWKSPELKRGSNNQEPKPDKRKDSACATEPPGPFRR